ncbi:MAG TPA: hypothetical protein VMU18_12315 [Rhodoblastus sp.]|nr:hypothetical protein [Rhodoblastus sp.]
MLSFAVAIFLALRHGQDLNWDRKNYHLGVAATISRGAFWESLFPAGIQSYFDPLLLQAQFYLMERVGPRSFAVITALAQSLAFIGAGFTCMAVARQTTEPTRPIFSTIAGFLGFLLCLFAPVALSELGTTFIDLSSGALVIGAFALLLVREERLGRVALAGALVGAATAFKLTNGLFAIGGAAFSLAGPERWPRRLVWLSVFGAAALVLFAVIAGPWHLELWRRFHNPFFPYFNTIFHSPDFPAISLRDDRFLPTSPLDIWLYPWHWLMSDSPRSGVATPSTEVPFQDIRWAALAFGATIYALALAALPRWRRQKLAEPTTGLFFAILASYLLWLAAFGIHRYLIPIDILCGAALLYLCQQIPWPRWRLAILCGLAIASFATMRLPEWGHIPFGRDLRAVETAAPLDPGPAIVFLTRKPEFYVAASFPASWRYVGLYEDYDVFVPQNGGFGGLLAAMLAEKPAPALKALSIGAFPPFSQTVLARFGLTISNQCQSLGIADDSFQLCDVKRQ